MKTLKITTAIFTLMLFSISIFAQGDCKSWGTGKDSTEAIKHHVLYRDYMKVKDYEKAFPLWEYAYTNAPGGSVKHFIDGIKIYKFKLENATEDAQKEEYKQTIYRLFDERVGCFGKEGSVLGRKAYNMFYLEGSTADTYNTFKKSVGLEGNKTQSFLLVPYASATVTAYRNSVIKKEEARDVFQWINKMIDENVAAEVKGAAKYAEAKPLVAEQFAPVERNIFDCAYFRDDLVARYKADPNNPENYREVYKEMIQVGCPASDAIVAEIANKDKSRVDAAKAAFEKEQAIKAEANAPTANKANDARKAGRHAEAIDLYLVAVGETNVDEKKGNYYYAAATIAAYKTKQYSKAREYARQAAKYMSGDGRPYLVIGDVYASGAGSCGSKTDDWGSRLAYLAAIDQWSRAKSVDPSLTDKANKKIGRYSSYKPTKEQAFSRNLKDGQSTSTGCWIGETVTIRTVSQY